MSQSNVLPAIAVRTAPPIAAILQTGLAAAFNGILSLVSRRPSRVPPLPSLMNAAGQKDIGIWGTPWQVDVSPWL